MLPQVVIADGLITRVLDGQVHRWQYTITCTPQWQVSHVLVRDLLEAARTLELRADGEGHWTDADGAPVEALSGCVDCDISATPFTNTLPLRRLTLEPGAPVEIDVAYIELPALTCQRVKQRYTCLQNGNDAGVFLYEGLFRGFAGELEVDADRLVITYPHTFARVWPKPRRKSRAPVKRIAEGS